MGLYLHRLFDVGEFSPLAQGQGQVRDRIQQHNGLTYQLFFYLAFVKTITPLFVIA